MSEVTDESDLLEAIKQALQDHGRLGNIKGQLRTAVMAILNKYPLKDEKPPVPEETKLINELIREYLLWNGYVYADQILVAECGLNKEKPARKNLTTKLGVVDDSRTAKIPLLYFIFHAFRSTDDT